MSKRETVYLSQLEEVQILWPGDVLTLAEFVLRCCDAKDKAAYIKSKSIQKSRPTIHGMAGYFATITQIPILQIEHLFKSHGLNLASTVEFDLASNTTAGQ